MEQTTTYTGRQLAKLSGKNGISRNQLARWDRAGELRAAHRNCGKVSERAYTLDQALGVIALGELRRIGFSMRQLRRAVSRLPSAISAHSNLIFDGQRIYARAWPAEFLDVCREMEGVRVLQVSELARKLAA